MELPFIANIYLLVCSGFGLGHGLVQTLTRRKTPIYVHFILYSILSIFLSRLSYVLSFTFYGGIPDSFNVGLLGFAASFFFLFLANFGQMDRLIKDLDLANPQYRVIAMIVPIAELTVSIVALFCGKAAFSVRLSFVVISVAAGLAGYINLKLALIPDVDFGIIRSIRGFNLLSFLMGILTLTELGLGIFGFDGLTVYAQLLLGLLYAVIIPVLIREVKQWTR